MSLKRMHKVLPFLLILLPFVCGIHSEAASTSSIVQFLKSSNRTCDIEKTGCTNDEFVGHCTYRVDCARMTPSVFEFIECDQTCIHPITSRAMRKEFITVQEITHVIELTIGNETHHLRSVIGCSCILTERGRIFRRKLQMNRHYSTI